jgi:transposase-like protein
MAYSFKCMGCPKCASDELLIRERTGWERIVALFTSLRKYRCRNCDHTFRAPDRRRSARNRKARVIARDESARPVS